MSTTALHLPTSTTTTAADPLLLHAFARRGRPVGVGELLNAMSATGLQISDVLGLLCAELVAGRVAMNGFRRDAHGRPFGPCLYELSESGWDAVTADRLETARLEADPLVGSLAA